MKVGRTTREGLGAGFSGHLGLRGPRRQRSAWFPISEETELQVRRRLRSSIGGISIIETLNNRLLIVDLLQMPMISLLDDGDYWPKGDHPCDGPFNDYAGLPIETYRLMSLWAEGDPEFEVSNTLSARAEVASIIDTAGFTDRQEELVKYLRHTTIHFRNGTSISYEANRTNLIALLELEDDDKINFVEISCVEGAERYYPLEQISLIEVSLLEFEAARRDAAGE
ncbi:hypothetical protein [uncultured Sphingomonas sp.]|uniref:hypothetical protein n=1 Tax=uncultured Sphingomonas sp. TaxID=158754 RepID=UPI0025D9F8F1|nr:hypothetical protein [uncultured Sphingomonas sp.]